MTCEMQKGKLANFKRTWSCSKHSKKLKAQ